MDLELLEIYIKLLENNCKHIGIMSIDFCAYAKTDIQLNDTAFGAVDLPITRVNTAIIGGKKFVVSYKDCPECVLSNAREENAHG